MDCRRGNLWTDWEVRELLNLWCDPTIQVQLKRKYHNEVVYEQVSSLMMERGFERTASQCRVKLKKLKLQYRVNKRAALAGRRVSWEFFNTMDLALDPKRVRRVDNKEEAHLDDGLVAEFQLPGPSGSEGIAPSPATSRRSEQFSSRSRQERQSLSDWPVSAQMVSVPQPPPPPVQQPPPPPQPAPPPPPPAPPEVCLRWNSYHSNMQATFPSLLNNEQFVDVTLACEGRSVKCHKVILSACSSYFEDLLSQNPCKHPIVFMKDLKFWEVQALVEFMYKGEVNVNQDRLPSLLQAAEALQIKGLAGPTPGGGQQSSPPPPDHSTTDESLPEPPIKRKKKRYHPPPPQPIPQPQPQPVHLMRELLPAYHSTEIVTSDLAPTPRRRHQVEVAAHRSEDIKIEPIDIEDDDPVAPDSGELEDNKLMIQTISQPPSRSRDGVGDRGGGNIQDSTGPSTSSMTTGHTQAHGQGSSHGFSGNGQFEQFDPNTGTHFSDMIQDSGGSGPGSSGGTA